MDDREVDRVLMMKKEDGHDYEVSETVTGQWSLEKEEVVMTEEVTEQVVFIEQKEVFEMKETVEEEWSVENKGEVVMITEEGGQVVGWMNKKPVVEEQQTLEKGRVVMTTEKVEQGTEEVFKTTEEWRNTLVGVHEMVEEHWLGKVVMSEEVEQVFVDEKQVVEVNEVRGERWSVGKEEAVVMTDEVEQVASVLEKEEVFEVDETVVERPPLGEEDFLEYTKTIYDRWKKQGLEIADAKTEEDGNMWETKEMCEVRMEYEKAVRKFLTHTTQCSKCVKKKEEKTEETISTISTLIVFWFMVQFVHQLFISSVAKSGGLLRRARFIIKRSYESVVTTSVFVYITTSYVSITQTLKVNTHDQVVDPCPPVIVTPSDVTNQGLIRRTWFVLEQSYHLIRVVTVKAYVSIKQTIIVIKRHTFGEVLEEVNENSQDDVSVDQSPTVVVTPSGVLQQSYRSVVTRFYVFLQETQKFVCSTKVVLVFSSVTGVTTKAYIWVKQTTNRFLRKKPEVVTPQPGSNDKKDNKVIARKRLFFFGVVCVLLCLSGTLLFMVNREHHILVTTKEDGSNSIKQVGSDGVTGKKDHVVNEKMDDKTASKKSDGKADVKQEKDHVVNEKKDDKTVSEKSDGKADSKHEKDHVVNEKKDDKTVSMKSDGKVDSKHEKDHVVNEKKDDKTVSMKSDGKVDSKNEKDHVVNEKKDDKTVSMNWDGKVDSKHEKDHVVNEKKDDKTVSMKSDGKVDSKHEKDHVVNEKKDDKTVSKKSDGKVDSKHEKDHVVNEKKDDKTTSEQSDGKVDARKEVGDLVTKKRGDNAPVITERFIRAQISYVTSLVLNIHIRTWSTIKHTYHRVRVFTWKVTERYGSVASIEVNVQEKDDVVRLLKTWISYEITLVQRGLQIEKVNLITGISVLSFVFFCVYLTIKNLRRTTINVVSTVINGVTIGSLFVARTIVVSAGAFLWVTVNIPRRTWSVLYAKVVTAVTASNTQELDGTKKKDSKHVITGQEDDKEVVKKDHVVDDKEDKKAAAKHGMDHVVNNSKNEKEAAKHGKDHVVTDKKNEKEAAKHSKDHAVNDKKSEKEAAKHVKDHVVNDKGNEKAGAKHGKDHVVDDKGNEKAGAKHGKDHVVDEKKHVGDGKEKGSLVTNNMDDNAVVKNEGLLKKSRISYVTTLVLNVHVRTWSTIKHTYHRVFMGRDDSHLVPDQGDGNIPPDNVSENGRVVIRQIKYMIYQVLKLHKWLVVEQVYHRIFRWGEQTEVVTSQDANALTNQTVENVVVEDRRVTMWYIVKQVYHRVFRRSEQTKVVITSQEGHTDFLTNQTVEDVVVGPEDRRVTMWSLFKQTSYQLVVRIKLLLESWKTIHVITRVQTGLLRIWSAMKLEKVLNIKAFGQATKKLLLWLRHLVSKEEILKSIVYGGLTEIIASISIVAFFADFDTTILNVIAFALAGLIGGCFFFVTNIWGLKKGGGNTYTEQLGRVNYFPFHATLAMLSFIIFGMIPPSTFVFSFLKTNDKKIAIWVASAVSILCLSLLAIFKAYVTSITYRFKYVKTVLWYHFIALGVSICSYLASKMVKGSIEDLGLFDTSTCDAMSRHN